MVNQVGGNDSLIFDGSSVAIGAEWRGDCAGGLVREDLVFFDTDEFEQTQVEQRE